jgi:NTP pyrophosphatase (non-canonical NTP hydrolase)
MRNTKEVMAILQEECAEVIQAVSKINRFGRDTEWQGVTNKQHLAIEIGDLIAVIKILVEETDINITMEDLETAVETKLNKLELYLPHI